MRKEPTNMSAGKTCIFGGVSYFRPKPFRMGMCFIFFIILFQNDLHHLVISINQYHGSRDCISKDSSIDIRHTGNQWKCDGDDGDGDDVKICF